MTISFLEQMKVIPDHRMTGMVTYPRRLGCCAGRTITAGPAYPADYCLESLPRTRFIRVEVRGYFKAFPAADRLQAGHIDPLFRRPPQGSRKAGMTRPPALAKSLHGV